MDSLMIKGGVPLRGEVTISGAKERRAADHGGDVAHRRAVRHPARAETDRTWNSWDKF